MAGHGTQNIAQQIFRVRSRQESSSVRIDSGNLKGVAELLCPCHAATPTAGRSAVIGKPIAVIVLQIVGGWQAATAAIDSYVALIIMKSGDLQVCPLANLA